MGYTRRQFVTAAFDEIGYADYVYDLSPDQMQSALRRLDAMMATWNGRGIRLGYPLPASPQDSDLDDDTNVPDAAFEAIRLNLAVRVAPALGKQVMAETTIAAKDAYNVLLARAAFPVEMQLPGNMPAGAGAKRRAERPFLDPPDDLLLSGPDSPLEFT